MKSIIATVFFALMLLLHPAKAQAKAFDIIEFFGEVLDSGYEYLSSVVDSQLQQFANEYNKLICRADWKVTEYPDFGMFPPLKVREYYCDETWYFKRLTQLGEALDKIFNDGGSADEKGARVAAAIEDSAAKYGSGPFGAMALRVNYSLEFGVARLKWNSMRDMTACPGVYTQLQCSTVCTSQGCEQQCKWVTTTFVDYVFREPAYVISRIVDNVETELARTSQRFTVQRNSFFQLEADWSNIDVSAKNLAQGIWNHVKNQKNVDKFLPHEVVWYDFETDLRPKNSTLSYKVQTFAQGGHSCPKGQNHASVVHADADGNGEIDFVPPEDYAALKRKLNAPLNAAVAASVFMLIDN
jgi:hypothetical protein